MKKLVILILLFGSAYAYSQSFDREASLPAVSEDGFYKVLLSSDITQHLNDQLSDIRIFDHQHREVPYLLQTESPEHYRERFVEYEMVRKESRPRRSTSLVLRNRNKTPIDNIHLVIKNAEASREVSLLGSDDQKNWFSIRDRFILNAPQSNAETQELKIVGFPWSNYEYYLLNINDSLLAPLNIVKAGYYETQSSNGKYTDLPLKMNAYDSTKEKMTYVDITFDALQFIDKLEIDVSGIKYYRRNAMLLEKRVRTEKNGKRTAYYNPIQNFELTTGRKAIVKLASLRGQHFRIEIANEDNPPLTISAIKAFQLNRYLTVWLTKDIAYTIQFGQPSLKAPVYDIAFFKDSIPENTGVITAADIRLLPKSDTSRQKESFFTNKNIVWIAIVIVVLILGYMSLNLVRDAAVGKTKD